MWWKIKVIALLMLISMVASASNEHKKCMQAAVTNLDMKNCSATALHKAADELDSLYNGLIASCKKSESVNSGVISERLKLSQNAWVVYRDANCSLEASSMLGGSGERLIQSECLVEMTEARILALKKVRDVELHGGC